MIAVWALVILSGVVLVPMFFERRPRFSNHVDARHPGIVIHSDVCPFGVDCSRCGTP